MNAIPEGIGKSSRQVTGRFQCGCLSYSRTSQYVSDAVAFECNLDGQWKQFGSVVHEALPEVHTVLQGKKITAVTLAWIEWNTAWP